MLNLHNKMFFFRSIGQSKINLNRTTILQTMFRRTLFEIFYLMDLIALSELTRFVQVL